MAVLLFSPSLPMSDFQTTCWTLVLTAGSGAPEDRGAALERLCRAYWPPAFAYIRRRGHGEEEARDLTQEFFARLLEKNWLESADRERGKFRSFLLIMLKRFLANEHDFRTREKRGGGVATLSLDWSEAPDVPDSSETPEQAFDRRWALTVMHRAAEKLRGEAEAAGRAALFAAASPWIASDPPAGVYEEIAGTLGTSKAAVSMAVHRLRLRLRELTRTEVAETLSDRGCVDAEMQELMAALRGR